MILDHGWNKRIEKDERTLIKRTENKKMNLRLFASPWRPEKSFAAPIRRPCRSFPRHNSAKFLGMRQGLREHYPIPRALFRRPYSTASCFETLIIARKKCARHCLENARGSWSLATSAIASAGRNPNGVIGICSLFDFNCSVVQLSDKFTNLITYKLVLLFLFTYP